MSNVEKITCPKCGGVLNLRFAKKDGIQCKQCYYWVPQLELETLVKKAQGPMVAASAPAAIQEQDRFKVQCPKCGYFTTCTKVADGGVQCKKCYSWIEIDGSAVPASPPPPPPMPVVTTAPPQAPVRPAEGPLAPAPPVSNQPITATAAPVEKPSPASMAVETKAETVSPAPARSQEAVSQASPVAATPSVSRPSSPPKAVQKPPVPLSHSRHTGSSVPSEKPAPARPASSPSGGAPVPVRKPPVAPAPPPFSGKENMIKRPPFKTSGSQSASKPPAAASPRPARSGSGPAITPRKFDLKSILEKTRPDTGSLAGKSFAPPQKPPSSGN